MEVKDVWVLNFNVDSVTLGISLESSMKCVQCVHQREISMYHDFNIIPDLLLKVEMTLELNKQVFWKQKINILQMSFRFYWVKIHSQQLHFYFIF